MGSRYYDDLNKLYAEACPQESKDVIRKLVTVLRTKDTRIAFLEKQVEELKEAQTHESQ